MTTVTVPPCRTCNGYQNIEVDESSGILRAVCPHDHSSPVPTPEEIEQLVNKLQTAQTAYNQAIQVLLPENVESTDKDKSTRKKRQDENRRCVGF